MSFEKLIRIPEDRIGVLVGKSGNTKSEIEKKCSVSLEVDSDSGEIHVHSSGDMSDALPFKAMEIVTAIGRGFSPKKALMLLEEDNILHIIDLHKFVGKSADQMERIKGRIIGENGKARTNMENLTNTSISVYGKTVSIIGSPNKLKNVIDAISSLSSGSMHGSVYSKLEAVRRREKLDKLQLWENQDVF
jgi:ribosomal RNA assembly protein|tara:strand:- start:36 stop:605 length:570 start_codon:yes stop_codon:yes gene_type:complete